MGHIEVVKGTLPQIHGVLSLSQKWIKEGGTKTLLYCLLNLLTGSLNFDRALRIFALRYRRRKKDNAGRVKV
jgi:hypothetical protein